MNNYLAHYGVKGMKWRKRKYRPEDSKPNQTNLRDYKQTPEMVNADNQMRGQLSKTNDVRNVKNTPEYQEANSQIRDHISNGNMFISRYKKTKVKDII